jgi:surface antigen
VTTVAQVAAVLRAELGTKEVPDNKTKYGAWYGMNGVAWCDIFQSWAFNQVGALDLIGGKNSYTPTHAAWFQKKGQWDRTPHVGDLVFFDWGTRIAHVGWVESVVSGGFISIEGNTDVHGGRTGGQVMRQRRSNGSIGAKGGFGTVKYSGATPPPPAGITIPAYPGLTREGMRGTGITRKYQQRLKDRGWKIDVDDIHGPGTSKVLAAFQAEKKLKPVDGIGGAGTWGALWA